MLMSVASMFSRAPDLTALSALPIFQGLTSDELTQLARVLHPKTVPTGTTIITAEQPGGVIYLILEGTVKVYVEQAGGGNVILAIRGPGEILGEMSLLENSTRSANVITIEEC